MRSPRTISRNDVRRVLASDGAPMTAREVREALGIEGGAVGTILGAMMRAGLLVAHPGISPRRTAYSLAGNGAPPKNASRAPRTGDVPRRMVQSLQPAPTHTGDSPERRATPSLALPPADELRCAIFHDATIVIDKAGVAMTLEPHECARLHEFLDQQSPIWQDKLKPRRKEASR